MPSLTIQKRKSLRRGTRYRAVIERWANGKRLPKIYGSWGPYQKKAHQQGLDLLSRAYDAKLGIRQTEAHTLGELIAEYKGIDRRPATWSNWIAPSIRYLRRALVKDASQSTIEDLEKATDPMQLAGISSGSIQQTLEAMKKAVRGKAQIPKPLAPNTMSAYGRHLTAMFEYARGRGFISQNPCAGVSWPSYSPKGLVVPDPELKPLWRAARARFRPLLWLLRHTGMRVGELVNLYPKQVDYKHALARVESHRRAGIKSDWEPKTEASTRDVPIPRHLMNLLGRPGVAGYVFQGYSEDPVERVNQASKDMTQACRDAKVGPYKTHHLKHTFCTRYLEEGGSVAKLSAITGTSIQTLMDVYAHILKRTKHSDMTPGSVGMPPPKPHSKKKPREALPDSSRGVLPSEKV